MSSQKFPKYRWLIRRSELIPRSSRLQGSFQSLKAVGLKVNENGILCNKKNIRDMSAEQIGTVTELPTACLCKQEGKGGGLMDAKLWREGAACQCLSPYSSSGSKDGV